MVDQVAEVEVRPWYADIANFVVTNQPPVDLTYPQKKRFIHDYAPYLWDVPYVFKVGNDQVIRRCLQNWGQEDVLLKCHEAPYRRHFSGQKIAAKVLQCRFFWPTEVPSIWCLMTFKQNIFLVPV